MDKELREAIEAVRDAWESGDLAGAVSHLCEFLLKDDELEDLELYVDDDGYVSFKDCSDLPGPGATWFLHHGGWEMYKNNDDELPIYETYSATFPTDDELGEGAQEYVKIYGG